MTSIDVKKRKGYAAVLEAMLNLGQVKVQGFMIDFEASIWAALPDVFTGIPIQGCCFHWDQALWRKVQDLGLSTAYRDDEGTNKYIRRLMALPFLPHEHIKTMFISLQREAYDEPLQALCAYIQSTWIESAKWPHNTWSVFMNPIRTNNDAEGWHRRINHAAAKCQLSLSIC
jgi:hypothetical protein